MCSEIKAKDLPSVMALSYLGDARHSLYVRKKLVASGISKSKELNEAAKKYVTAEAQAKMFSLVEDELTELEKGVARRASNSTHLNKPKHASGKDYRLATGFEAVIGMLEFINDVERLEYLLDLAHKEDE
jgi:ribonuclease-3 family protein